MTANNVVTETTPMTFERTVWGYDPNWVRVEAFDDRGESLGLVTFEPRENVQSESAEDEDQICRMSASFRSTVRTLIPSSDATSTLS